MHLGLAGTNIGGLASPAKAVRLAILAEELGYESLWTSEHIVLPDVPRGEHRWSAELPMLDPLVFLSYIAAVTRRIRLATGILLLPQHEPRLLAKQVASLDYVCNGRFILGIGVGNQEIEARAMGVTWRDRGALADDYLEAMRALWSMPHPSYAGKYVTFAGINAHPRPVQAGGPPVIVGGHSAVALRRAARHADGWYGVRLDLDQTRAVLTRLREVEAHQRLAARPPLEISVLPTEPLSAETVQAYAELGVDRLVVWPPDPDEARLEEFVRSVAPAEVGL
ncbi:MAG TPA: LLM class F420-dependent oxidoreductase [Chloroflexota bacterium]